VGDKSRTIPQQYSDDFILRRNNTDIVIDMKVGEDPYWFVCVRTGRAKNTDPKLTFQWGKNCCCYCPRSIREFFGSADSDNSDDEDDEEDNNDDTSGTRKDTVRTKKITCRKSLN